MGDYWIFHGVALWLTAPSAFAWLLIPHLSAVLHRAYSQHPHDVLFAVLFGAPWGVGDLTFGWSIRYLGIAWVRSRDGAQHLLRYSLFLSSITANSVQCVGSSPSKLAEGIILPASIVLTKLAQGMAAQR